MPVLTTAKQVMAWAQRVQRTTTPVFFDTETSGLNPRRDRLIAVQCYQEGDKEATVIDARRIGANFLTQWLPEALNGRLLVGHNLKFDLGVLAALDIMPTGPFYDTMLAMQVLHGMGGSEAAAEGLSFGLASAAKRYADVSMSKEERNWFIGLPERPQEWEGPFPDEQVTYMRQDVEVLPKVYKRQQELLEAHDLQRVASLEMRVLPALAAMEATGVHIDVDGWRAFIVEKEEEARRLEGEALAFFAGPILSARLAAYDTANEALQKWKEAQEAELVRLRELWDSGHHDNLPDWLNFKSVHFSQGWKAKHPRPTTPKQDTSLPNLGSPAQLLDAFHVMGLDVEGTGTRALADYGDKPAVAALLAYRKAVKFVQSFGETLLAKVEADGRIHPDYRQIGASTGRMSCSNPNWQQVPSKGDGKRLRRLVTPAKGNVLVCADFSNIELRILAALSGDEHLTGLFSQGLDLHSELAYSTFGLSRDTDVKATEFVPGWSYREVMKMVNYGLVYGMSAARLSATIHVSRERAEAIMAAYFKAVPGVRAWLDARRKEAYNTPKFFSKTAFGRVRRYPSLKGLDEDEARKARNRMARQAMNTPIQGLSADVTKVAVAMWHEKRSAKKGRLVAVVHDELVVEANAKYAETARRVLAECMDKAQRLVVKLPAEALPCPVAVAGEYWSH